MSKRFTEGICFDGAAILDNGKQITITEILNNLNKLDELEAIDYAHSSLQLKEKYTPTFEEWIKFNNYTLITKGFYKNKAAFQLSESRLRRAYDAAY